MSVTGLDDSFHQRDFGVLAQLGEQGLCKAQVEGSSPSDSTKFVVLNVYGGRQDCSPCVCESGSLGSIPRCGTITMRLFESTILV